jgi:hypothetical protein
MRQNLLNGIACLKTKIFNIKSLEPLLGPKGNFIRIVPLTSFMTIPSPHTPGAHSRYLAVP